MVPATERANALQITSSSKSFVCIARSEAERDDWLRAVAAQIEVLVRDGGYR